jgi:hypothetical protein
MFFLISYEHTYSKLFTTSAMVQPESYRLALKDTRTLKIQRTTFIQQRKKLQHFQAHRKRAKRQQHLQEELERFFIQLCSGFCLNHQDT